MLRDCTLNPVKPTTYSLWVTDLAKLPQAALDERTRDMVREHRLSITLDTYATTVMLTQLDYTFTK